MRRSVEEPENEENAFQDAFKQKLQGYRAPVNAGEWSRLEETLNADAANKRRPFAVWLAAACVSLFMLATGIFGYLKLNETNQEIAFKTVAESAQKVNQTNPKLAQNKPVTINKYSEVLKPETVKQETSKPAEIAESETTIEAKIRKGFKVSEGNSVAINQPAKRNLLHNQDKGLVIAENSKSSIAFNAPELNSAKTLSPQTEPSSATVSDNLASETILAKTGLGTSEGNAAFAPNPAAKSAQNSTQNASVSTTKGIKAVDLASVKMPAKTASSISNYFPTQEISGNEKSETSAVIPKHEEAGIEINVPATIAGNSSKAQPAKSSEILGTELAKTVADSAQKVPVEKLATIVKTETATPETKAETQGLAIGKWQVAFAYSALKFNQNIQILGFGNNKTATDIGISNLKESFRFNAEREFNDNTRSAYSWQGDLKVGYNIHENLVLQSGLTLTSVSAKTPTTYFLKEQAGSSFYPTNSMADSEMPVLLAAYKNPGFPNEVEDVQVEPANVRYQYQFIGLPVELQYHTNFKSNWNIYAGGGPALNYLTKSGLITAQAGNKVEKQFTDYDGLFHNWQVSVNSSAGVSYKLNTAFLLTAGLVGSYFLQPLTQDNLYLNAGRPYSYGLNTGVVYKF